MTMQNIITSFRITGLYPVDHNSVIQSSIPPKLVAEDVKKKTGISIVPLYTLQLKGVQLYIFLLVKKKCFVINVCMKVMTLLLTKNITKLMGKNVPS